MGAGVEARAPGAAGTRRWQRVYGVVMPLYKSTRNEEQTPCRWRRTRPAAARRKSESGGAGPRERSRAQGGAHVFPDGARAVVCARVPKAAGRHPDALPVVLADDSLAGEFVPRAALHRHRELADHRLRNFRRQVREVALEVWRVQLPLCDQPLPAGRRGKIVIAPGWSARAVARTLFRRPRSGTRASRPKFSGVAPAPLSNRTYGWAASDQTTFPQMPVKWRAPGRMANFVPSSSASLYVFSYTLIGSGCAL